MSDLQQQIRNHYRSLATPITMDEVLERADRSSVDRGRVRRRPPFAVAITVMGAVLVLIGVVPTFNYLAQELAPTTSVSLTQPPTTEPGVPETTTTPGTIPLGQRLDIGIESFGDLSGFWTFRSEISPERQAGLPGAASAPILPSADGFYWQFEAEGPLTAPVLFNTTAVVGSADGTMYALDMTGPPPLWAIQAGSQVVGAPVPVVSAPVLADVQGNGLTTLFLTSLDGRIRSQEDVEGLPESIERVFPLMEELPLEQPITAPPLVFDGRVFFGAGSEVWALDARTLTPVWNEPLDVGSPVTVSPVGFDGSIFVGTLDGSLYKIDAASGAPTTTELCYPSRGVPISIQPVIADGLIYITVQDGDAIDIRGAEDCEIEESIALSESPTSPPAIAGGVLYVGNGNFLEAWELNAAQVPRVLWRFPDAGTVGGTSGFVEWPVSVAGGIYFTTSDGWLHAVDRNGEELWRYNVGARSVGLAAPGTGVVLVADITGTLHAIGCENPPDCR